MSGVWFFFSFSVAVIYTCLKISCVELVLVLRILLPQTFHYLNYYYKVQPAVLYYETENNTLKHPPLVDSLVQLCS